MASSGRHPLLSWFLIISLLLTICCFRINVNALGNETYLFSFNDTTNIGTENTPVYRLKLDIESYDKIDFTPCFENPLFCVALMRSDDFDLAYDGENSETRIMEYGDQMFEWVKEFYTNAKSSLVLSDVNTINEAGDVLLFYMLAIQEEEPVFAGWLVIEWTTSSGSQITENKARLEGLIKSVTGENSSKYYQTGDRYNGTGAPSEEGYWAELTGENGPLNKAQNVFSDPNATIAQVDNACSALSAAIAKLIPTSQLNATALYEAISLCEARYFENDEDRPVVNGQKQGVLLSDYTDATADAYRSALVDAKDYLALLFNSEGEANPDVNTPENQETANGYAVSLLNAKNQLLLKSQLPEGQRYRDTIVKLDAVFSGLDSADYEASSWSAFETSRSAASAPISEHPANESMNLEEYGDYVTAARNYYLAAYGLKSIGKKSISLHVGDTFGLRFPEYAGDMQDMFFDGVVELSGNTLKDLFTQVGLTQFESFGRQQSWDNYESIRSNWVVTINGVQIKDPIWSDGQSDQNHIDTVSMGDKTGTEITWEDICVRDGDVVTVDRIETALSPTFQQGGAPDFHDKEDYYIQLFLSLDETEVKEGDSLSGSVTYAAAYLLNYDGRERNTNHYRLAAYPCDAETNQINGTAIVGSADNKLVLSQAGKYLVVAFDDREQDYMSKFYPNLSLSSVPVLVSVRSLEEAELEAVKAEYTNMLEDALAACVVEELGDDIYGQISEIVSQAKSTLSSADSVADIMDCYSTAVDEIVALKEAVKENNERAYRRMSSLLMLLPNETEIEAGLFTKGDEARMNEAIDHYASMTEYQHTMLTAGQTAQWNALQEAWVGDGSSLSDAKQINFTISVEGGFGTQLENAFNEFVTDTYSYNKSGDVYYPQATEHEITSFAEPLEYTFDAPIEDWGLIIYYDDSSEFEVYRVTWEGVDESKVEFSHTKTDNRFKIELLYSDALKNQITKPAIRGDVKITIYTRSTGELASQQAAAVAELDAAYASYSKADYSAENWAVLTAAYSTGVAVINTAASQTEIDAAKQTALDAMEAVDKKAAGDLGSVTVIVENTTFENGAFTGTLASTMVDLTTDSTMMKCVLTALASSDTVYSWTGTGGKGYEITYLSSIYIDANGNGKPDDGEKSLAEFDGGPQSGWMGTLNDWFVNEGFNMFTVANGKLKDGDVIRVQYTVTGYGTDLGATWANNDTSLAELDVDGGNIAPTFVDPGGLEYILTPEGGSVSLLPTAANKNFQVRIFLNQQNKSADAEYYRRGESIPVKSGDVVWIGVGEKAWGTMNDGSIVATWYKLNVVSKDDASAVIKLITAIGSITYSNYETKQAAVEMARAAYEALTDDAKAKVGNYSTLTKAEALIEGYQNVGALKEAIAALPRIIEDTKDARDVVEDYKSLKELGLDSLLTIAEINKVELAAELLDILNAIKDIDFTTAEAYDKGALNEALVKWLNDMKIADSVSVSVDSYNGAVSGKEGNDGSYSATVTLKKGNGTAKKTVSGAITRSSDTGVSEIVVNKATRATGSGTAWSAVMPYGSDPAAAQFSVTLSDKTAEASAPATADGGKTWTFTVTAEDGSTAGYTVTLTISEVKVTVLDSNVYDVSDDTVVTSLSPVGVSGLAAIVADDLDLPTGTKEASVWLMLKIKEQSDDELTLTVTAWYAADGKDAEKISDVKLKDVKLTVTVPLAGTEYTKVRFGSEYLKDTKGSTDGIEFPVTAAGDYTLIPDASLVKVTFHLNGGTSTAVTDGQQIVYFPEDVNKDLPLATREGDYSFEGWFKSADGSGVVYTKISADLPTDLYAVWKSLEEDVEVIEYIDKKKVSVDSVLEDDGTAVVTVKSAEPCVVILKDGDSYVPLKAVKDGDSYVFIQKDYEDSMVFIVAAKGDFDGDGDLDADDFTAANKAILNSEKIDTLQLLIMGANGKKIKTVDLAKLYLALASGKVEW